MVLTEFCDIEYDNQRKPHLLNCTQHLSISHSHHKVAISIDEKAITGIDIQIISPKIIRIKEKFLNPLEISIITDFSAKNLSLYWSVKEALFKVIIHEIKEKELPELDDEFAKDVDFETLDELKEDTKQRLEEKANQDKETYYKEEAVKIVTENATIDIPEAMIDYETEKMVKDFEQQLVQQGMNLEVYLQYSGAQESELREQFKVDAIKRVKADLVLEAIAEKEEIEASEEEVDAEIKRIAEIYNRGAEEIKDILCRDEEGIDRLKTDLKFRKALDFLVEESK